MLRSIVCAGFALVLCVATVLAGEHKGQITKVEDGKITVKIGDAEKVFTLANDCEITAGKKTVAADVLAKRVANPKAKKGVSATITTDDDDKVVKKIVLGGGKKKKKDQ